MCTVSGDSIDMGVKERVYVMNWMGLPQDIALILTYGI